MQWAIPEIKQKIIGVGLSIYFFENFPRIFWFLILALEILDKTKLHPKKLHKFGYSPQKF